MEVLSYATHSKLNGTYLITFTDAIDHHQHLSMQFAPYSPLLISGDQILDLSLLRMRDVDMIRIYLSRFGHTSILPTRSIYG